jgi:hypothetical protein
VRSQLAKGKVAAENGESPSAEPLGQCHEKPRVAVRSSAVSKDEAIPCRTLRAVQVSSNAYFIYQKVTKLSVGVHTHRVLQPKGYVVLTLHPVCRELRMACSHSVERVASAGDTRDGESVCPELSSGLLAFRSLDDGRQLSDRRAIRWQRKTVISLGSPTM